MHRLFVAIRPPAPIRALLLGVMGGISDARWQHDDQLHLTIRFLGEVDRHQAADVHAALGAIHHPPFEIAIDGIGTFDRRGRPEMVWAGAAPHAPLRTLHKKVDQAMSRVGIAPDQRAYLPHITLARLKRSSSRIGGLLEQHGGLVSAPFRIDHFGLFESDLTPEGAVYSELERFALD